MLKLLIKIFYVEDYKKTDVRVYTDLQIQLDDRDVGPIIFDAGASACFGEPCAPGSYGNAGKRPEGSNGVIA